MAKNKMLSPAIRIATWNCFMHGAKDLWCCERAILRYSLPRAETLGAVPWARRSDVRHELQQLHSELLEMRNWMAREQGSLVRTRAEFDRFIGTLQKCKRLLS